jgi:hypothetical protein
MSFEILHCVALVETNVLEITSLPSSSYHPYEGSDMFSETSILAIATWWNMSKDIHPYYVVFLNYFFNKYADVIWCCTFKCGKPTYTHRTSKSSFIDMV